VVTTPLKDAFYHPVDDWRESRHLAPLRGSVQRCWRGVAYHIWPRRIRDIFNL